ncbi:MAG: 50S ribosomal protein L3, partial [Candidatus Omnitrophica bacterium]|nr:50S ribosomal protein L3 [Candidatus Omnitrophota bacterium]
TAVQAGPCTVLGLREPERHGYRAVQVGFEPVQEASLTRPERGQFKRAKAGPFRHVREFRLPAHGAGNQEQELAVGQQLTVELFQDYELVDVTGISIGKGFQGGMKRWGWSGGPATHGSMSHRAPGSIGSTTTPGRVWRGHHLPGHMGADRVTVQNVRIVRRDAEHHLLLLEGSVPGAPQGLVFIRTSQKRPGVVKPPQAFQTVIEEEDTKSKGAAKAAKATKTK